MKPNQSIKLKPSSDLRISAYNVIMDAIERGIDYGYRRAHKHTKTPGDSEIKNAIYDGISNELSEVVEWGN